MIAKINEKKKYYYGTGRRKTAVARVRIYSGDGSSLINGKECTIPKIADEPIKLVGKSNTLDISVVVSGGGKSAQSEAIRHGISRALVLMNPDFRPVLKKAGFLTRDPREVERKKPGLKKARRAPQWSKR